MQNELEKMLSSMKKYLKEDNDLKERATQKEEAERQENAIIANDSNWRKQFKETVETIEGLGFEILSFDNNKTDKDYYAPVGIYECQYKGWNFTLYERPDPDIPNMLQVYEITHSETGEQIKFYADLNGHNTSKDKTEKLIKIMDLGQDAYIKEEFGKYIDLPELFREKGYDVVESDFVFDLTKSNGFFTVNKNVYLFVSDWWGDTLVVSSDPKAQICYAEEKGKVRSSFPYKGQEDFEELCKFVELIRDEIEGRYGFFENGQYLKNKDIEALLDVKNTYYNDRFALDSEGHIEIFDCSDCWEYGDDGEGAPNYDKVISHAKGVELYKQYELRLRDRMGFLEECICQIFTFEITYNKHLDAENCILTINQQAFFNKESVEEPYSMWDYENELLEENHFEHRGTFTECLSTFADFLEKIVLEQGAELSEQFKENRASVFAR